MNCVSGGASKNLPIQQKEAVLSIKQIMPESLYACSYDMGGALVLQATFQ